MFLICYVSFGYSYSRRLSASHLISSFKFRSCTAERKRGSYLTKADVSLHKGDHPFKQQCFWGHMAPFFVVRPKIFHIFDYRTTEPRTYFTILKYGDALANSVIPQSGMGLFGPRASLKLKGLYIL